MKQNTKKEQVYDTVKTSILTRLGGRTLGPTLLCEEIPMDTPIASDVKVFVPAKNFSPVPRVL